MTRALAFMLGITLATGLRAATLSEISRLIDGGHWSEARRQIAAELERTNLEFQTREDLLFQRDRMKRILRDFDKTREQVLSEAREIAPTITEQQFAAWENSGAIELMDIDGTRHYFDRAAANLFRVNPEAKALKAQLHPDAAPNLPYRIEDIRKVIADYVKTGKPLHSPRAWRFTYTLSVNPGEVPPGETIRAWLPFPHADGRQSGIRLISTDPSRHILSDPNGAIASVYMEKPAATNEPTEFKISFEYTSDAWYQPIDAARVQPVPTNDPALEPYLGEKPPEIVFAENIRKLSRDIVGDEMNPYLQAQRIFAWVGKHVPWASAREYSTIECLPQYALTHGHGDCGIETMTFMTLCRLNGIPARWESGWITGPERNMHDWCEIYLAPYGWVPVDVYYGVVNSTDEREKWFYLGGIDASRFVVNTDYGQPLYPAKTFFRSEIVDFQRGEVEWRGGNLYFNQWNWDFQVQEISSDSASVLSSKP